jgi:DNA-binding response OmpR family regulator
MSHHRVLVVEDDEQVKELVAELLTDEGFIVATAATGQAALEMLDRDDFALMVTDIALPGDLDGLSLVRHARTRHPGIKSLFISGRVGPTWDDSRQDDFLSKPFLSHELLGCVWELLLRRLPQKTNL